MNTNFDFQVNFAPNIAKIIIAILSILILDFIYLGLIAKYFSIYPTFDNVQIYWGLIAWIALAYAISIHNPKSRQEAIIWGAFIGFVTYAVFNGTELAIRPDYRNVKSVSCDMIWGIVLQTMISLILFETKNKFNY